MKNYIRTCLSLNHETREKAIDLAMILGTSMSEAIKEAVKYFYDFIAKMNKEEQ